LNGVIVTSSHHISRCIYPPEPALSCGIKYIFPETGPEFGLIQTPVPGAEVQIYGTVIHIKPIVVQDVLILDIPLELEQAGLVVLADVIPCNVPVLYTALYCMTVSSVF
jgi:hypothetical protein